MFLCNRNVSEGWFNGALCEITEIYSEFKIKIK